MPVSLTPKKDKTITELEGAVTNWQIATAVAGAGFLIAVGWIVFGN
jgi:hypothetical protein